MIKSKIFLKAMLIVTSMILIYSFTISIFTLPEVKNTVQKLEEKNAKEILKKVVMLVNNVHKDLNNFEKTILKKHEKDLTNLTDTIWSIIQTKYEQSKPQNIGLVLEHRSQEFKSNLMQFYNTNKDTMSEEELKKAIINHINIYRYNEGTGYFWANDFAPKMIIHPILPELNQTNLKNITDPNNIYIFKEMIDIVKKQNAGIIKYKWINPKSQKLENKISYVFRFEPFNWIIGTGEYYNVLKEKLQKEVFALITKARYDENNYFFISNYNNILLSHPYLQGQDFSNAKDIKGNLVIPSMVKIAKESGEGFYSYWWKKNTGEDTIYKKLSYIKDFPDWQIIIGTGVYIDDIEKEINKRKTELIKQLREVIMTTKLGKTGYLYIFNKKGKMLIHPNENLDGNENFYKVPTPRTGKPIYNDLVNASQTQHKSFYYKWDKPSDKGNYIYDKISWVEYIPELDWYIGSSVYTEEFEESANEIRNFLILISFIVLILALIYSFIFFKNLLKPLNKLSELVSKVSKGDFTKRYPTKEKNDEISALANEFNNMLNIIENRNTELEESNDELEQMVYSLKKTQNKLIETEKLAGLGKLVEGITHEIDSPVVIGLTASSHFAYLAESLEEKFKNENITKQEMKEALKEIENLSSIIYENLTKTSQIVANYKQLAIDQTSDKKRVFNIKKYTQGIIFSLENIIEKEKINIEIICEENLEIESFPGLYSQILTHLVQNSIKHAFEKKDHGNITIEIYIKDEKLYINYQDDGIGIDEEKLLKIFEPIFSTQREKSSNGLGLSIIYNIITNNFQGTIDCKSKIDEGVLFEIILPI